MNIREAQLNDIGSIKEISTDLGYENPPAQIAQDRLQAIINSTSDKIWVAEDNSQIIGWLHAFLALRVASASFVEIGGISVPSSSRKKGTGSGLIFQAQSWAAESGVALRVRCNSLRGETHRFYRAVGFSRVKEQYVFEIKI